jgi:hypothetical protein
MTIPRKTADIARLLGQPYYRLAYMIRAGLIAPPPMDSARDYCWRDEDVEAARRVLAERRKKARAK